MTPVIYGIRPGLIVSCQALPGESLHGSDIMARVADAAERGGAVAIRANGAEDVRVIKRTVSIPVIGLIKRDYPDSEVYITPTLQEVDELHEAGADMIALDATNRPRPQGCTLVSVLQHAAELNLPCMADISTLEEAVQAEALGAACISTTLSGYTSYSPKMIGPHLELVREAAQAVGIPLMAEGRISEPAQVEQALRLGAYAVVVGSAITRPQWITARFAEAAAKVVTLERQ
ncbi:N-acetylmannosamine-6-phosphate 2-epimerase [Paenibacillus massiliensis]|uniref:N-acetylmannosamine-6-phosphate 2-epimerase n=1 Tax=Paenibacillus massiliensis TaxID=225917 RepID=UPI00036B598F|nr:N-acetylmannosamine-6-phosphate 2-epimerase [Paenibacillus massiliensis]